MTDAQRATFVAECFWPGVRAADLHALDARAHATARQSPGEVIYLGSVLMREDEVVLCRFQGAADAVTRAAQAAGIPYTRILEMAQSPWEELQ